MHKFSTLFFGLMFASSIIVAAGCSRQEEPAKPAEEVAKAPEPDKMPGGAKAEEGARPSEPPAPEKK